MRPGLTGKGYPTVSLRDNGKSKSVKVHRLVAEAFLPEPELWQNQINHDDGNKRNNVASNLEWSNNSENQLHAYRTKLKLPCDHPKKKSVLQIDPTNDRVIAEYQSIREAAKAFKIYQHAIRVALYTPNRTAAGFQWRIK